MGFPQKVNITHTIPRDKVVDYLSLSSNDQKKFIDALIREIEKNASLE
jgi:hypothetical protein